MSSGDGFVPQVPECGPAAPPPPTLLPELLQVVAMVSTHSSCPLRVHAMVACVPTCVLRSTRESRACPLLVLDCAVSSIRHLHRSSRKPPPVTRSFQFQSHAPSTHLHLFQTMYALYALFAMHDTTHNAHKHAWHAHAHTHARTHAHAHARTRARARARTRLSVRELFVCPQLADSAAVIPTL